MPRCGRMAGRYRGALRRNNRWKCQSPIQLFSRGTRLHHATGYDIGGTPYAEAAKAIEWLATKVASVIRQQGTILRDSLLFFLTNFS